MRLWCAGIGYVQELFSRSQTSFIIHHLSAAPEHPILILVAMYLTQYHTKKYHKCGTNYEGIVTGSCGGFAAAAPCRPVPSPPLAAGIICRRQEEGEGGGGVY